MQHFFDLLLEQLEGCSVGRGGGVSVLDEVTQMRVFLFADWSFERDRLLRNFQNLFYFFRPNLHRLTNFLGGRFSTVLLKQPPVLPHQLVDRLNHVHWDTNFDTLHEVGYDGWMVIEAFGLALPELVAATKIWRRMYQSEEQLAREGLAFMRKHAG